jgi:hypothetical protein
MNSRSLIILVGVALVAVAAVVWINRSPESLILTGQALVPGLAQNINQVSGLRVTEAGNKTVAELKQLEQGWVIVNKANYPADVGKVRETLLLLANARLLGEETADPESYGRLGVQDFSAADATGTQVDIEGPGKPVRLIIGKPASGGGGTYVRRAGEPQSFLVSGILTVPGEAKDWLEHSVLDIPAGRIQSISIRSPDGSTLTVEKQTPNQAGFTVLEVPPDRNLKSGTVANPLANGLAGLWLEDVAPASEIKPADGKTIETNYLTFDGLKMTARVFQVDNHHYVHFNAGFDEEQARRFAKPAESGPKKTATRDSPAKTSGLDETRLVAVREEAKRLEERLNPWVYVISAYKYDAMSKRMDDLLKPTLAEEEEEKTEPAAEPGAEEESPAGAEPETETEPPAGAEPETETEPPAAEPGAENESPAENEPGAAAEPGEENAPADEEAAPETETESGR